MTTLSRSATVLPTVRGPAGEEPTSRAHALDAACCAQRTSAGARIGSMFLLCVFPYVALGAWQNQVTNPDFDSGTDAWLPSLAIGSGGVLSWDPLTGDPLAGSAKVDNVFVEPATDGWRQCVPISDLLYSVQVNVAAMVQAGNGCRVRLDFVKSASCFSGAVTALEIELTNSRNDGTFEMLGSGGKLQDGILAAGVFLEHVRVGGAATGDSSCWFDHVGIGSDTLFRATFE